MVEVPWREAALTAGGRLVRTSVTEEETAELQRLAAGRRCLEVGSAFGWSACAMILGGAESVTAVDLHEPHITNQEMPTLGDMGAALEAYGAASRVHIIQRSSQQALPELADAGELFGLIFIDADHEEGPVRHDVTWARKLLSPGGVLACHDYGNDNTPGVKAALDAIFPEGPTRVVHSLWVLET